ncbi:hypothetical protein M5689_004896 [Euphorbia peplus]|nr:hypothetical protein M5689_004896 [Euphorbia peplus]
MSLEVPNLGLDEVIFSMKRTTHSNMLTHELGLRNPLTLTALIDIARQCVRLDSQEKNPLVLKDRTVPNNFEQQWI